MMQVGVASGHSGETWMTLTGTTAKGGHVGPHVQASWTELGLIAAFTALVIVVRQPEALANPQFWAEDGAVWYQQAYHAGMDSLLQPQNGYFQTVSKLTALLSLSVPLVHAPLLFNLVALFFKILPVLLILSARGRELLPGRATPYLVSALYVMHPYSWEVYLNVTNIHWHLALAALVVLFFERWHGSSKFVDLGVVALSGFSGVFAVFLAPIALWRWIRRRSRRSLVLCGLLCVASAVQLIAMFATASATRSGAPLGASVEAFVRILGGQLVAAGLLGERWRDLFVSPHWTDAAILPLVLAGVGLAVLLRAASNGPPLLRGVVLFAALVFMAALIRPQISGSQAQWPLFEQPNTGGRYVFIPIIGLHASLLWLALAENYRVIRWAARLLLAITVLVAFPASWRVRPLADLDFPAHAARFEAAAPGTVVEIPINPQGWSIVLRKKAIRPPDCVAWEQECSPHRQ